MTQLMDAHTSDVSNLRRLQKQDAAAAATESAVPQWLADLRRAGMARLAQVGFPTTKQEEWRFTNARPIAKTSFPLATPEDAREADEANPQYTFGAHAAAEIVFVNRHYRPEQPNRRRLHKGVTLLSLADALGS